MCSADYIFHSECSLSEIQCINLPEVKFLTIINHKNVNT